MRVASVPAGHPYVQGIARPEGPDPVVRLPDPPVPGARPEQWWPPPMLEPAWVRAHAAEFDVFHLHFGFDDRSPAELRALVAALAGVGRPLVLTLHDLRNPHHVDPAPHTAALDVLVPAAAELITLTSGAADEVSRRWGRRPVVIAHPAVVPPWRARVARPERVGFTVGVHAKSVRTNSDPVGVARALVEAVRGLPGARVRVDVHDDGRGRAAAAALGPEVDLRSHPPFSDEELWDYLQELDLSVLPYRWGTHSGWLETCHDLGTAVLAPAVGHYADQAPCLTHRLAAEGPDPVSLTAAVRWAYRERPRWRADPEDRERQRWAIAAAHEEVYARVAGDAAAGAHRAVPAVARREAAG
ncbi:glycosyltransferase family 1 protein [Pseudonocardia xishanensis]|uniref:D-inositol 3-phosphate glycosyltransferase n=1 Tax=Pseudonocardia xishanensis TaxID=630995 RepID=A0ABP8S394_9PSEU